MVEGSHRGKRVSVPEKMERNLSDSMGNHANEDSSASESFDHSAVVVLLATIKQPNKAPDAKVQALERLEEMLLREQGGGGGRGGGNDGMTSIAADGKLQSPPPPPPSHAPSKSVVYMRENLKKVLLPSLSLCINDKNPIVAFRGARTAARIGATLRDDVPGEATEFFAWALQGLSSSTARPRAALGFMAVMTEAFQLGGGGTISGSKVAQEMLSFLENVADHTFVAPAAGVLGALCAASPEALSTSFGDVVDLLLGW